jgi:hypothetical protein
MPSFADPDPGSKIRCFFDPWIRMEKIWDLLDQGGGSVIRDPE